MSVHGPLDSFTFDGSSNGFEVAREYVLQDNGTLSVLSGLSEYPKRPSSPGLLPSHLSCPVNPVSPSLKQQSSSRDVLASKPLDSNFDNSHGDLYRCEVCSRTFSNLQCLHRHQQYRNDEGGYRCTLCCKLLKGRSEIKRHFQNHTFERFQGCKSCGKRFVKADALKIHITQNHSSARSFGVYENNEDFKERTYTCKKCKLTFFWLTDFQTHLFYLCKGKKVSSALENELVPKVTKDNLQTCNGTSTHSRKSEKLNMMNASIERDSTYRCGLCGEQFPELTALKRHHTTHQSKMDKQTLVKAKSFKMFIPKENRGTRKSLLKVKLKMYPCKLCTCVFRHSSSLSRHMKYHEGSTCELCGELFRKKGDIIKHLMIHKTEMKIKDSTQPLSPVAEQTCPQEQKGVCGNYKCLACGRKFGLLCVYRMHLQTHKKGNTTAEHEEHTNCSSKDPNPCLDEMEDGCALEDVKCEEPVLEKFHAEDTVQNGTVSATEKDISFAPVLTCIICAQTFVSLETFVQHQVSHN